MPDDAAQSNDRRYVAKTRLEAQGARSTVSWMPGRSISRSAVPRHPLRCARARALQPPV